MIVASKAKVAIPVVMGMLDAVLVAFAFLHGAPSWVCFVILLAWWAGMPLYKGCFDESQQPRA
jgi:hypothetical protein